MLQSNSSNLLAGIRHLIFDFGGVIIGLTRNRCIEAFEQIGVDVHEKLTNNYQHKDMFMQLELGTISPSQFRDSIRSLSEQTLSDQQIDEAWMAMLGEVAEEKLRLLKELHKRYNTMLLSNTNLLHWEWSERHIFSTNNHQISDYFHRVYLSYEMHLVKPDPEIFVQLMDDAGIRPEETLLIDDALVNCKAAEALGMRTYMPEPREDWTVLFPEISY